jgi:cytochrome P450
MSVRFDPTIDDELASDSYRVDPYPVYRQLRREHPVYWSERFGFWLLSRYGDVLAALRDGGPHFSLRGTVAAKIATLDPAVQPSLEPLREHYATGLMHSDPPEHTRVRRLISNVFTPRTIEGMRPQITAVVDRLLDEIAPGSELDLVRDFAFPLPAIVISSVLGLDETDRIRFKAWSDDIAVFIGTSKATPLDADQAQTSLIDAREYLGQLADLRRGHPRDDLISRLVSASEDEGLTPGELLSTCVTFLIGGHETTTALISSAVFLLSRNPVQRRLIMEDPSAIQGLVEETIRYETPGQRAVRRVANDVQVGESLLREGQTAMLMLGAANRDEDYFDDPERFDLRRNPNRHLGFGLGPHACIGAPLARLESQIALTRLFARFRDLTVSDEPPDWIGNFNFRQLRSLSINV